MYRTYSTCVYTYVGHMGLEPKKLVLKNQRLSHGFHQTRSSQVEVIISLVVCDLPTHHLHEFVVEVLGSPSLVSKSSSVTCPTSQISLSSLGRSNCETTFSRHSVNIGVFKFTSTFCQPDLFGGYDLLLLHCPLSRTYMCQFLWRTCCIWDGTVTVVGMHLRQYHPFPVSVRGLGKLL